MSDSTRFNRRDLLKTAGVTVGTATLLGSGVAAATDDYDTVVDIVDAGADPTGTEPIDDVFGDYDYQDDTLIQFPDGRYLVNNLDVTDCQHYAMQATGDATLVPGPDYDVDVWIGGSGLRDFVFEGFTIDNTATGHHPTIGFSAWDDLVIRDIHKRGFHDGENTAFGFSIWEDDGSGLVENLRAPDGSEPQTAVGCYVGTNGRLTFRDCTIQSFGNNGLYASTGGGDVHVEGGVYKNNDISQVRLGSPNSSVRGATIAVDDPHPEHDNARGIRISDGPGPVTIEGCSIIMERGQGGGGVVGAYSGGSFDVRNSRIYVGPEYTTVGSDGTATSVAILADEPTGVADPGSRTIENVAITGGGTGYSAGLFRRGNNTIEDVCIHQSGSYRDGLVFADGTINNDVASVTIDVPGTHVTGPADVWGLDDSGQCAIPDYLDTEPPTPATTTDQAPLPWDLNSLTYAEMGTAATNPTATLYGNFKCPYTRGFVDGNFQAIREEFVDTGALNIRYRDLAYHPTDPDEPYLLDAPQNELISQIGLGVWAIEPENYWQFFEYVFENQASIDWTDIDAMPTLLDDAGIRNWGKISIYVDANMYETPVHDTAGAARDAGVSFVPQLELGGDTVAPHHDTSAVLDWIATRL